MRIKKNFLICIYMPLFLQSYGQISLSPFIGGSLSLFTYGPYFERDIETKSRSTNLLFGIEGSFLIGEKMYFSTKIAYANRDDIFHHPPSFVELTDKYIHQDILIDLLVLYKTNSSFSVGLGPSITVFVKNSISHIYDDHVETGLNWNRIDFGMMGSARFSINKTILDFLFSKKIFEGETSIPTPTIENPFRIDLSLMYKIELNN